MVLYENRNKEKPRIYGRGRFTIKNTINQFLRELTILKNKIRMLKIHYTLAKKRADKWKNKYEKDLKNHDKIVIDNQQICKTNEELNLMHHQAIVKVLNLGQEIIKLKGKK